MAQVEMAGAMNQRITEKEWEERAKACTSFRRYNANDMILDGFAAFIGEERVGEYFLTRSKTKEFWWSGA